MNTQAPPHITHPKTVRSFVVRAGRTTRGQAKALAELGPAFVLPYKPETLDTLQAFGRHAPLIFEIGFGMGDATATIAQTLPEHHFLGCEVHEPGVGALLKRIGESKLTNIRILQHDAVEVLETMMPPQSLDGVHVFFPDPWHKTRHHKRRLIQPPFVDLLTQRLKPGGYVHLATDWEPYAHHMLAVLRAQQALRNTSPRDDGFCDPPAYRPLTKFERRGQRLGHSVWDLVFEKISGS